MTFSLLNPQHDRASFSCGNPVLDSYLRERARKDVKRRMCQVYVLGEGSLVVGFYTLSPTSVDIHTLPPELARKFPNSLPLPCLLLGRLAVDIRYQKQGIGRKVLAGALKRARELSDQLGGYCVIVDAKDEGVKQFYEGFGFKQVVDKPLRLYLPVDSIPV